MQKIIDINPTILVFVYNISYINIYSTITQRYEFWMRTDEEAMIIIACYGIFNCHTLVHRSSQIFRHCNNVQWVITKLSNKPAFKLNSNMTFFICCVKNVVIKLPIYFILHMYFVGQIINTIRMWFHEYIKSRGAYMSLVLFTFTDKILQDNHLSTLTFLHS